MILHIDTPIGKYKYKYVPIYLGFKPICKPIAKENLLLLKSVLDEHHLRFILLFGTLLGAVREHDFIAHDEDIDIVMMKEDMPAFLSLLFELREHGFEVARYERRGFLSIIRKGEYIDFSFFQPYPGDKQLRYCCRDICKNQWLDDVIPYPFQGSEFLIPRNYIEYFEFYFGNNWQTPIQTNNYNQPSWVVRKEIAKQYVKVLLPEWLRERLQSRSDKPFLDKWIKRIYPS